MRGNYRDFAQRLIDERNFTYYSENESVPSISLRGVIDSKENSEVYVFGDSNSKQISNLDVYLPEQSTWRDIYREYETYVNHFKADYSVLDSSAEFSEYTSGDEVQQVRNGNCDYSTAFDVPGGIIIVRISRYMQVQLSYICC